MGVDVDLPAWKLTLKRFYFAASTIWQLAAVIV